jgi:site-specific recombinase XerD
VFAGKNGKPTHARDLRAMVKQAGVIKAVHPHLRRQTFAKDLYRPTKNLRLMQAALGHSNIAITKNYTHAAPAELEDAMKGLRN